MPASAINEHFLLSKALLGAAGGGGGDLQKAAAAYSAGLGFVPSFAPLPASENVAWFSFCLLMRGASTGSVVLALTIQGWSASDADCSVCSDASVIHFVHW